jgi:hypothetical protein
MVQVVEHLYAALSSIASTAIKGGREERRQGWRKE